MILQIFLVKWTSLGYAPSTPVCKTGVFLNKLAAHIYQMGGQGIEPCSLDLQSSAFT